MNNITAQTIVGELVASDYNTASIFQSYGIDFCCKGNKTIDEACANQKVDVSNLFNALQQATEKSDEKAIDYNSWPLDLLADYIEKKHHRYVEMKTREIKPFLNKIVSVHGLRHPELEEVQQLFDESAGELAMHMKKEELILFPFIRKMVAAANNSNDLTAPRFGTVQNPITAMLHEHDAEGDRFARIAALTQNYTPPVDACNTYRVTLAMLKEFEEDLHLHIHLENNILFPKSIAMEEQMLH